MRLLLLLERDKSTIYMGVLWAHVNGTWKHTQHEDTQEVYGWLRPKVTINSKVKMVQFEDLGNCYSLDDIHRMGSLGLHTWTSNVQIGVTSIFQVIFAVDVVVVVAGSIASICFAQTGLLSIDTMRCVVIPWQITVCFSVVAILPLIKTQLKLVRFGLHKKKYSNNQIYLCRRSVETRASTLTTRVHAFFFSFLSFQSSMHKKWT